MELIQFGIPKSVKKFVIAPIGDIQWSGEKGPTAQDSLKRHIDRCLELDAYFVGLGDYIDFLSPSGRRKLSSADLYDTAKDVVAEKAMELNQQVFEKFLKPTVGRWMGLVEGHHFFEGGGVTTDQFLADWLKTAFLGTSGFIRVKGAEIVLYLHHGNGGGVLPGSGLNKPYHIAAGLEGADVYLFGHDTKMVTGRLSRPYPDWTSKPPKLIHRDIYLVRCGGFSRSNIVGHRQGTIPRGDYAEQASYTPSPLAAPLVFVNLESEYERIRVAI